MTAKIYARLKAHCHRRGVPIAAFVEACLVDALDDEGEPEPVVLVRGYRKRREDADAQARSVAAQPPAHFTF